MCLVEVIKRLGVTEMLLGPGTLVLRLVFDTLRGREPLSRLEACVAQHNTAGLSGQALLAKALTDETVGCVLDSLYQETGTGGRVFKNSLGLRVTMTLAVWRGAIPCCSVHDGSESWPQISTQWY